MLLKARAVRLLGIRVLDELIGDLGRSWVKTKMVSHTRTLTVGGMGCEGGK